MPSMMSISEPLPNVRVARRSKAPSRPQTSQVITLRAEPRREEDELSCGAELDDGTRFRAGKAVPLDDVLALPRARFALDGNDRAGEDDTGGIDGTEAVLFEFFRRVPSDDISVFADAAPQAFKES